MNSKGFTLVELLLTIAILGLLIGIAVPSYVGISSAIRKNQRNNIIERIEIAASKYAYDTGETIIFVNKLVTEGYIESDDEEGNIEDPVNNERMNCYIIEMEKVSDYYNAKFIDGKNYDNNGNCDLTKLQENSEEITIQVVNDGNVISDTTNWLKGNVNLKIHSNNTLVIDCTNNKCVWTSSSGATKTGNDNIEITPISGLLETRYTFQYTIYNSENSEVIRYKDTIDLKIDNDIPVIYSEQITVTDRYINTSNKVVKIVASDGKGSGIVGYYLGNNVSNCNSTGIVYQNSNSFNVTENGNYLICVKDAVGNVSASSITINYIS